MANTQLTFYGHAAFKVLTPAGNVLLIDPVAHESELR